MTAVVLAVTFKCIPLQRFVSGLLRNVTFPQPYITFYLRFTEISYLCSIRDVLGQWGIQLKSSYCQQLLWFPFSELTVMTHLNPTEKYNMVRKEFMGPIRLEYCRLQAITYSTLSVEAARAELLPGANRRGLFPHAAPALAARLSEPSSAPLRHPLPHPVLRAVGRRQEPLRLRALPAAHVGPAGGLPWDELARARRESPRGIRLSHCTG